MSFACLKPEFWRMNGAPGVLRLARSVVELRGTVTHYADLSL